MMNLKQATRIAPGECIAFSGAGGKTTALFILARELNTPVLVTTTTHFGLDQLTLADKNMRVDASTDIGEIFEILQDGVLLLRGAETAENKVAGIPDDKLEEIYFASREREITLLIEADGSRQLPLKAPASHEPQIPPFVDRVIVVAGLSGLGQPLSEKWVHRPKQFADISGLNLGESISPFVVVDVLKSPYGGQKGIPPEAKRIVLLNQADIHQLQSQGTRIAKQLTGDYDSIIVASLKTRSVPDNRLSEDQRVEGYKIFAAHEPVGAIILAAGKAVRMGRIKQLLPWKGKPLLWHVAQAALSEGLEEVIIIIGAEGEQIREPLNDLNVRFVENPDWELGQSTSLQVGLRALSPQIGAAIFLLADQPQVSPTLIRSLIEKHATTLAPIIAPIVDGKRGNPVLFDRRVFNELMSIHGDTGGRELFSRYPVEWLEWHDARVLLDIDTEEDYQRLLNGEY